MNGFETAEMIRQRPSSELTPIIFVTALDQAETDLARGYELGAVDFVFAPVVPAILRAKVQVFAELYKAQQELRRYRNQLQSLVEERTTALTAINRELEAFNSFMSNDVRAPLLMLETLTKSLLEGGASMSEVARAQAVRVQQASQQLTSLFDGMQMLFKLTRGELHREDLDITRLSMELVGQLRAGIQTGRWTSRSPRT